MEQRPDGQCAGTHWRGASHGMRTRTYQATGETLLAPGRNTWKRVGRITQRGNRSKARGSRTGSYELRSGVIPTEQRNPAVDESSGKTGRRGRFDKTVHKSARPETGDIC